jgi:Spy/CpxP family protein refolding chaperone
MKPRGRSVLSGGIYIPVELFEVAHRLSWAKLMWRWIQRRNSSIITALPIILLVFKRRRTIRPEGYNPYRGNLSHRLDAVKGEEADRGREGGGRGGATADLVVRRLSRSLDLDPTQRDQVRAIVTETRRGIVEIRKPVQSQVEAAFERSRVRVRTILRPDQQEKFDRIQAERRKRRERPE